MLTYLLEILAQNKIGHLFSGHYVRAQYSPGNKKMVTVEAEGGWTDMGQ